MSAADTSSVIVAGARTPMGRLLGGLKDFSASDLGAVAIKGALEKAGVAPEQVDYVIMGQVLQAGAGQIPARQAAVKAGIPMTVPGADHQQGLPVGHRRDRAGRPADPGRRVRDRRRRRPGVDDPGAAFPAEVARGREVRRHEARRLDVLRRSVGRVHHPGDGRADRGVQRRAGHLPRGAGRLLGSVAPAGGGGLEERPVRRRGRVGRDPAAQGRPDLVPRRRGHPARHDDRDPRPSCGPPSARTAPSPPARRRRSPTVRPRSS